MAKLLFTQDRTPEEPTIVLAKRDHEKLGVLKASQIKYKDVFDGANEMFFVVYKYEDEQYNTLWDSIIDHMVAYIPEYDEYYDMTVQIDEETGTYKTITLTALAESELSQTNLYDIEINTEADIAREDYDPEYPTVFSRTEAIEAAKRAGNTVLAKKLYNSSLLHRLLDKAKHYSVGHVDTSLEQLKNWYAFSISETSIYDELVGEVAEQFHAHFEFDSYARTVSAYDLYANCNNCGYRGDYEFVCPECGSTNVINGYGKRTTIFISKDNLAASASVSSNKDSLKNCFRVSGGDDLMTATIANCNPNGSNYIYYFSPDAFQAMPDRLSDRIKQYNEEYTYYNEEHQFKLGKTNDAGTVFDSSAVNNYNSVVNEIRSLYQSYLPNEDAKDLLDKYVTTATTLTGFPAIAALQYQVLDFQAFLEWSMFPILSITNESLDDTARVLQNDFNRVAVNKLSTVVKATVENAILNYAKTFIHTGLYKLSLIDSSWSSSNPSRWTGKIRIISIENNDDYRDIVKTITITEDVDEFLQEKIEKILAKEDTDLKPLTDIEMDINEFKRLIKYYNLQYLSGVLLPCFQEVQSIIIEAQNEDLTKNYQGIYSERVNAIESIISLRYQQIEKVETFSELVDNIRADIRRKLDFEKYLGEDLWKVFCSYRREDSYNNPNYVYENLTNAELMQRAKELLDAAAKELYAAGNLQYDVTGNLNNLLVLPEFEALVDDFAVGNWIHMSVDDKIYPLRLLSYEIDFDNKERIDVEFSTASKIWTGLSDIKEILGAASSMATSYNAFVQQVQNTEQATEYVNNWVRNGLDATATRIVNNADNQAVTFDRSGLWLRRFEDIEDKYDPCQTRLINNGIYTTSDNWKTVDTALGRFSWTNPEDGQTYEDYGLIAKTIVGQLIIGETLKLYNRNASFKFDSEGIKLGNGDTYIKLNPDMNNSNNYLIQVFGGGKDVFTVDKEGNAEYSGNLGALNGIFKGTIQATDGELSNMLIKGYLTTNAKRTTYTSDLPGLTFDPQGIGANNGSGQKWWLTNDGHFYANDAEISGIVNIQNGGSIGGWKVTDRAIYGQDTSRNTTIMQIPSESGIVFGAGGTYGGADSTYPFRVTHDGKIYAEQGEIGGWSISKKGLQKEIQVGWTEDLETGATGSLNYVSSWNIARSTSDMVLYIGTKEVDDATQTETSITSFYVKQDGSMYGTYLGGKQLYISEKITMGNGNNRPEQFAYVDSTNRIQMPSYIARTGVTSISSSSYYTPENTTYDIYLGRNSVTYNHSDYQFLGSDSYTAQTSVLMTQHPTGMLNLSSLSFVHLEPLSGSITAQGTRGNPIRHINKDTKYMVSFGVGSGGYNRGVYDDITDGWIINADKNDDIYIGKKHNVLYAKTPVQSSSDRRLKKDIKSLDITWDKFYSQLSPVSFTFKDNGLKQIGFIAQDVEQAINDNHLENQGFYSMDSDNMYHLNYTNFIALNTYMIQQLKDEIKTLKAEIKGLKGER